LILVYIVFEHNYLEIRGKKCHFEEEAATR